jgi:hypothetical protein
MMYAQTGNPEAAPHFSGVTARSKTEILSKFIFAQLNGKIKS